MTEETPGGERTEGFVYMFHSPAMPGIYKVGRTNRNPFERVQELSSATGVPIPYAIISAAFVRNCALVEGHLHRAFNEIRVNTSREFFAFPDHAFARKRFRDEVLSLPHQLEDFGVENAAHDLQTLGRALRDKEEAEILARQQAQKIGSLELQVRRLENKYREDMADQERRFSRLIADYKSNSDYLSRRIAEIKNYCSENRSKPAGLVIDFIENPRSS